MAENISKVLSDRRNFIELLESDISKNNEFIEHVEKECSEISKLSEDIKSLAIYPEQEALIPLTKNFYMKGKIVHTGESYIYKSAHPESYMFLRNSEQIVKMLENDVKVKEKEIMNAKNSQIQLEERKGILTGIETMSLEKTSDNFPNKIMSDKGVAVKVGEFYEILEFED